MVLEVESRAGVVTSTLGKTVLLGERSEGLNNPYTSLKRKEVNIRSMAVGE